MSVIYPKITTSFIKLASACLTIPEAPTIVGAGKRAEAVSYLKKKGYKKALIITSPSIVRYGFTDVITEGLKAQGMDYIITTEVAPDPTFAIAQSIRKKGMEAGVDCIIAIGGGSVLDCSKLVAASLVSKCRSVESFAGLLRVFKKPMEMIAIPSTAGTGSESTFIAVISNSETHQKKTMVSPKIVPDLAILDGEMLTKMPAKFAASTGMDALSHAVESYISTFNRKKTHDKHAPMAIKAIFENLYTSFCEQDNVEVKNKMLLASYYAGISMNNEMVGYAHAFAHQLGGVYGVPHGEAIGITLPQVLEYNRKSAEKKMAKLAVYCGLGTQDMSADKLADAFISKVKDLRDSMGLPAKCDKLKEEDYDMIIANAFKETSVRYPVARFMTKQDARDFLNAIKG